MIVPPIFGVTLILFGLYSLVATMAALFVQRAWTDLLPLIVTAYCL
jgi:hypothetical protein